MPDAELTWEVDDELARELGAPHHRDVVLQEKIGRHKQLLQNKQAHGQGGPGHPRRLPVTSSIPLVRRNVHRQSWTLPSESQVMGLSKSLSLGLTSPPCV